MFRGLQKIASANDSYGFQIDPISFPSKAPVLPPTAPIIPETVAPTTEPPVTLAPTTLKPTPAPVAPTLAPVSTTAAPVETNAPFSSPSIPVENAPTPIATTPTAPSTGTAAPVGTTPTSTGTVGGPSPQSPVVSPTGPANPAPVPAPGNHSPQSPVASPTSPAPVPAPTQPTETQPTSSSSSQCSEAPLLWSEEFNYNGPPDDAIWSYDLGGGGWGNNDLQVYTSDQENVFVEDDVLKITTRGEVTEQGTTFTSARIKTENKFSFKYGTLEARIKPPNMDAGLWPAFWTMGADFPLLGWPAAGEIDIFEMGQGLAITQGLVNNRVVSAAHWDIVGQYATYARWYDSSMDLTQNFHTYRMEWTPTSIATYVDDDWIWEMDISESECPSCEAFHKPHFLLLNMAVGGGFTSGGTSSSSSGVGSSSSSGSSSCYGSSSSAGVGSSSSGACPSRGPNDITAPLPAEMQVEWIRLYDNCHTSISTTTIPRSAPINDTPVPTVTPSSAPTEQPSASPISSTKEDTPFPTAPTEKPSTSPISPKTNTNMNTRTKAGSSEGRLRGDSAIDNFVPNENEEAADTMEEEEEEEEEEEKSVHDANEQEQKATVTTIKAQEADMNGMASQEAETNGMTSSSTTTSFAVMGLAISALLTLTSIGDIL